MNIQMQMPERVIIEENSTEFHSQFIMQPLEQGYGVTIGNSLRRILLSSIPGSAITGLKISDVLHEFQTIDGVVEDVSEIILNLKQVRIKNTEKKPVTVNFTLKGAGTWTAKDIQNATSEIEIINQDLHIATLAEDAEFDVELKIGRGKGYVPAEEQNMVDYPVGMLPIDSVYAPVRNVIFNVEPYRVGHKTDYERLVLDVKTDGTITAQESLHLASKILSDHIKFFINFDAYETDSLSGRSAEEEEKLAEKKRIKQILETPVDELELSVRAHNCLKRAEIGRLADLVSLKEAELLKFRNFGKKSLTELRELVANNGLEFGMNVDQYLKDEPKSMLINN
jgi:DNA-directed RNA polymerase subunit alpha